MDVCDLTYYKGSYCEVDRSDLVAKVTILQCSARVAVAVAVVPIPGHTCWPVLLEEGYWVQFGVHLIQV